MWNHLCQRQVPKNSLPVVKILKENWALIKHIFEKNIVNSKILKAYGM